VKLDNVGAGHVDDAVGANPRVDEELNRAFVLRLSGRFAMGGDVFIEKPLTELLDRRRCFASVALGGGISAKPDR
jgi:hypothetical protein